MIKALLKKQGLEYASFFLQGKDGKPRKKSAVLGFAALMLCGIGAMGASFYVMADSLCEPLVAADMAWVYFSLMGVYATALGAVLMVFSAKVKLYEAKDNDLLFSMPIPAHIVLFARILGLYLFTLLIESLVLVPCMVEYFIVAGISITSVIGCLAVLLLSPLFALGLGALLGLGLAWVTARLPYKNLFTTVIVLAFIAGYMALYTKINEYLTFVLANGEAVGKTMKTVLYPFSQLGYAATGNMLSLLLSVLMFGGAFGLIYLLLVKTYFKVATMKRGERKAKYKEKTARTASPLFAFFKKEFAQLIKKPMYLINASMGTMIAAVAGVFMLIYGDFFGMSAEMISMMPKLSENIGLLICAVACFMASSNTIAACSVSLEGEKLWIPKSLPVDEWTVLKSKFLLHFTMTAIPAGLFAAASGVCVELSLGWAAAAVFTAILASALFGAMDLAVNLKLPSLRWTNEIAAIKQSASVMIAMFGGWGISLLPVGGYFLFGKYLPPWAYAGICFGLISAGLIALLVWLKKRGTKLFREL